MTKKNDTLTVRLPDQVKDRIRELAKKNGADMSSTVLRLINAGFKSTKCKN